MRSYSRRELYAFGETLGDSATYKKATGGYVLGGGGGGGSPAPAAPQPTQTTVQNTNIPDYAQPYVETMLGTAQQQIYNYDANGNVTSMKPYQPYSNDPNAYIAGFSPLQQQAQSNVANMQTPGQYGTSTAQTNLGTMNAYGLAGQETQAGNQYAQQATNPYAMGAYMNPYVQQSLAPQLQLLAQQTGINTAAEQSAATSAGAFGGSREALANSLQQQQGNLAAQQAIAQGYNTAYGQAQNAMQYGAGLGLQGQQAANAALGTGIQGAGQNATIAGQQTQTGLNINTAQQAAGAAQQAQQQNIINQQIQNYATAQQYPMMQLANMSNLLHGLPLQSTTTQSYQAAPSSVATLGGLGATALGAYGASGGFKSAKKGGVMKSYAAGGPVSFDVGGSVDAQLYELAKTPEGLIQLQQEARTSPSAEIRKEANIILAQAQMAQQEQKQQGVAAAPGTNQMFTAAGGGIVAFDDNKDQPVDKDMPAKGDTKGMSFEQKLAAAQALKDSQSAPASRLFSPAIPSASLPSIGSFQTNLSQYMPQDESQAGVISPKAAAFNATIPGAGNATSATTLPTQPVVNKGLGDTPQAAPVQAANPAPTMVDTSALSNVKDYYTQLQGLMGTPEDRKAIAEQIKTNRQEAKDEKERDMWLALMKGGAKAMASKSPFASVGLGEGAEAGAEGIGYANKAYNDAMKAAQSGELDLAKLNSADRTNLLHYAVTGAVSDANTRQKMAELKEIAAARAQTGALGIGARQDAAITARAKLLLGNNPMPTEQDVQNAIDMATKQVTGKGATGGGSPVQLSQSQLSLLNKYQ